MQTSFVYWHMSLSFLEQYFMFTMTKIFKIHINKKIAQ